MKITTFNPMILTKKPEEAIALFEAKSRKGRIK